MTLTIPQRNSLVQEYLWCIDSVIKQNYSLLKAAHLDWYTSSRSRWAAFSKE